METYMILNQERLSMTFDFQFRIVPKDLAWVTNDIIILHNTIKKLVNDYGHRIEDLTIIKIEESFHKANEFF